MIFPGWTIARAIPYKFIAGFLTGQYTLTGGVIRHAAGTARGGQIAAHLLPASNELSNLIPGLNFIPGIMENVQLYGISNSVGTLADMTQFNTHQLAQVSGRITSLSQTTQSILNIASGTALISGLGLAVSALGFMVLNKKLSVMEHRMREMQKDIKAIKEMLEQRENAKFKVAIQDLMKVDRGIDSEHKNSILIGARKELAEINEIYQERLCNATILDTAVAHEEFFCLTGLAQVRCTAELGMLETAHHEIQEKYDFWKTQSRRITNELLIGEYPERFLASDFAEDVPVSAIVDWMDFANEEKKGLGWIDMLRMKIDEPWYKKTWQAFTSGSGLNKAVGVGLEKEKNLIIPTLHKLVARNNIFEGYVSQYEMLETNKIKPSEFELKAAELPMEQAVNGYFILQPEQAV